ncbi:OmpA family protein [Spirosoma sp. BT704]|uniref:OmpA family protein n=2 Tax=Spirosoma validum TaxID=2771355 RepID=A0A927GFW8_9BACT|nr:OmpA family protein [Spirosoma validum]
MSNGADTTELKIGEAVDSAGNALKDATAKLGAFFKRKLPSGLELNIPEFGIENNLVKFIEDTSKPVDKTTWFNFDRLLFDTGKATLRPESQEQLTNIAAILKEYPNVHIKLGGYTDNTGSAEVNKKLSQERADSVMGELIRLGIDKSRLEAEGYGPEYPVASNDTEAGRAENRRIAIRVTQK